MKRKENDELQSVQGVLGQPDGQALGFVIQKNGVVRAKKIWKRKPRKYVVKHKKSLY